ncbi:hypothetical protein MHH49_18025 [Paenibacillus sp. FSL F4-0122]|uniref:hypothetical protein n=1 Tax=Paenibacillus sp. FSL F4-0122 TaxID=2921371 RepID=UPI0030F8F869
MTSFIWGRDPQEAYQNPYEYEAQDQFYREASNLLGLLFNYLTIKSGAYTRDEQSAEKAIWMLFLDSLESLIDCLDLLQDKKHRIAGRLFRDAVEAMDTASYFYSNDAKKDKHLRDWYNDKVIQNRVYRDYIKENDEEEWGKLKKYYSQLSKINHRTYRSLAYSYLLGSGGRLIYEGRDEHRLMVPPHVIAMYYALIGGLISHFVLRMVDCKLISAEEANVFWSQALEEEVIERRFISPREAFERFLSEVDNIT